MTRHKTRALKKLETDLAKLNLREVVSNAVRDLATPVIGIEFESSSSPDSLGTSRAGGLPDLPESQGWPNVGETYAPIFALQINLEDLLDSGPLPGIGLLSLFIGEWNPGYDHFFVYTPDLSMLERKDFPEGRQLAFDLDENWKNGQFVNDHLRTLRDCSLSFTSVCSWDEQELEKLVELKDEERSALWRINGSPTQLFRPISAMYEKDLSWIESTYDKPIPGKSFDGPEDPAEWEVFMALASASKAGMNWHGDSHTLIFAIPRGDIENCRFDRTCSTIDG